MDEEKETLEINQPKYNTFRKGHKPSQSGQMN